MKRRSEVIATCLIALCVPVVMAQAQSSRPPLSSVIDPLFATRTFHDVAISPDGTRVAWVEFIPEKAGGSSNSAIYVAELSNATSPRRITAATDRKNYGEQSVSWSPDGKRLAFLSDAQSPGQTQLCVADASSGAARKLTNLTGYLDDPQWSPDGKSIALLFTENAPRAAGPLMPMTPETGVVDTKAYEQRLTTVDPASGNVRQLSPPDMYVYEYDWSPDNQRFAVTAAHGAGDDNWYIAQLYTIAADGGAMKPIYRPPLQMAIPRWSPDGKSIAFIAGIMSDEGAVGGDIFTVAAAGGAPRNVTPGIKSSPNWLSWTSPDQVLFTENRDGSVAIATVAVSNGRINSLWAAPEVISSGESGGFAMSLARDRRTSALIRESFSHPPEVWAGPLGQWKQITHVNQQLHPTWGEAKSIHWNSDGKNIQGWLLYPSRYDPGQRYPMVVSVHGGPAWANLPHWPESFYNTSVLSSLGYFVLYPNPRGSHGQGEAFTSANVKDFGYGDFRDILRGVDQVVKDLPIDDQRVGITGWSYGGYMTMWAVTQTKRFRAAVSGAGLADWLSYYGENDIDQWMIAYFGASVYDDPAVYARSAPITFIKNVKTPTLVVVGERDGECPMPQSREFWHALKTFNVPTQFVVYPNEGHHIASAEHRRDIIQRMVGWFDQYLK